MVEVYIVCTITLMYAIIYHVSYERNAAVVSIPIGKTLDSVQSYAYYIVCR